MSVDERDLDEPPDEPVQGPEGQLLLPNITPDISELWQMVPSSLEGRFSRP